MLNAIGIVCCYLLTVLVAYVWTCVRVGDQDLAALHVKEHAWGYGIAMWVGFILAVLVANDLGTYQWIWVFIGPVALTAIFNIRTLWMAPSKVGDAPLLITFVALNVAALAFGASLFVVSLILGW